MIRITHFFDKLEDKTREYLSHFPIPYAIIGGFFVVVFWRGVWETADILSKKPGWVGFLFYPPTSVVISSLVLLITGLFVSFFIGDRIILSGLKKEKKIFEKTETEVRQEGAVIFELHAKLDRVEKELREVRDAIQGVKE